MDAAGTTSPTDQPAPDELSSTADDPAAQVPAVPRVSPASQFLRIAATMTGGVSLAIWMGGVAREIDLLCQASAWRSQLAADDSLPSAATEPEADPVTLRYLRLLDELDIVAETDVLSGTSAGGINAALLGYAQARGKDLSGLRDVWTGLGSLGSLLRDPRDSAVPSLMYGDGKLWTGLYGALLAMPDAPRHRGASRGLAGAVDPPETTLFITTTLLNGETSRFTDSYGTVVQDVEHHGLFTFLRADFLGDQSAGAVAALALAARSSASFPAAFEPSYIPYDARQAVPASAKWPLRPSMGNYANVTRSHWAADGGLLANRPIGPLLQAIFDRPASVGVVRRVLLYVVPSAGGSPDILRAQPGDSIENPYGLVDGLFKDLSALASQSISSDLHAIQDHNDRVSARTDARLQLAELGARLADDERLLTPQSLAGYVAREAANASGPIIAALLRRISTWPTESDSNSPAAADGSAFIPKRWADYYDCTPDAEVECRRRVTDELGRWWRSVRPDSSEEPDSFEPPDSFDTLAAYGRPAYDGAKCAVLAILRNGYVLVESEHDRRWLAGRLSALHDTAPAAVRPPVQQFVDARCVGDADLRGSLPPEVAVALTRQYLAASAEGGLAGPWAALAGVLSPETLAQLDSLSRQAGGSGSGQAAGVDRTVPPGSDAPAEAPPAAAQGSLAARRRAAAQNLGIYLTFLRRNGDGPLEIALQLFDLHATQRSILPVSADLEQPVEFVQISADTRTLLNLDRYSAASKLTGLQLHHFGAFYKASWRVNDWMWGRLDGAGWLVHLLLDPRRIQLKAQERADPGTVGASEWFIRLLSDPDLAGPFPDEGYLLPAFTAAHSDERQPVLRLEHIRDELEYLDDPSKPTPVSLPLTALWVSRAWQESIAAEEVPVLAATVLAGPGATAATVRASAAATVRDSTAATARRSTVFTAVSAAVHSWQSGSGWKSLRLVLAGAKWAEMSDEAHSVTPSSARWANEVTRLHVDPATPLSMIAAKLASCPVPSETFKSEVGSALLTRTTTHSAATAVAAVATVRQLPTVVRPILASLRTVTLTGFRATTLVDPRPRRLAFVGAIAILLGVAAASQQSMLFGLGGLLVAGVGAYLVAIAAWGASRMLLISMLSILLLGGIASLAVFSVRRYLFGTSGQNGVIGRHLHWAADAWWHPFLLLGVGLLVIALLGIAFDPVGRRRKAARTPPRQATGSGTRGR